MSWLESLARGAGQGATANWGDEGAAKLLDLFPAPADPQGTGREYAAGSAEKDHLQKFRRDNASAAAANPEAYIAGQMAGAVPMAAALPGAGAGSAAARVATAGLTGGALGGLAGAGGAEHGQRLQAGARGAALGGLLGTGLGAVSEGAQLAGNNALQQLRGVNAAVPAGVGASSEAAPGVMMHERLPSERPAIAPPRRTSGMWDMPTIPKQSNPGMRESMVPKMDELAERADVVHGDKMLGRQSADADVEGFVNARDAVKPKAKPAPEVESAAPKTWKPPRKKAEAPARRAEPVPPKDNLSFPVQQELPHIPQPKYSYHATPTSNAQGVADVGLRPEQGGKNFSFKKNQGRVYMSHEGDAPMWAQKLEDFSGEKPLELRTPLSSQNVPGADAAVRIRTEPVPPDRLQFKSPSGQWRAVSRLRQEPAANSIAQILEQMKLPTE